MNKLLIIVFFISTCSLGQNGVKSELISNRDSVQKYTQLESLAKINLVEGVRVWTNRQVVDLFKLEEGVYSGMIMNYITKVDIEGNFVSILFEKHEIPPKKVKKQLSKLKFEEINTLKTSNSINSEFSDIDGLYNYILETKYLNKTKKYSYWMSLDNKYETHGLKKISSLHDFLIKINSKFSLLEEFNAFRKQLPIGVYLIDKSLIYKRF